MRSRRTVTLFIMIGCAMSASRGNAEKTYAERLGWKAGDRVVIFHGDDAGLSHNTNTGLEDAMEKGLLSSASIMMPTPWVPEIVKYAKEHPKADFGLHLTLTSEWELYRWGPVAGKPAVPGLVDEQGCLWRNVTGVAEHASADEVEREIRAQIDRAETMGLKFTHMDTHMGTLFAKVEYFKRYMKIGIEKKIPILASGSHGPNAIRENGDAIKLLGVMAEQVWKAGLPVLDDIHTDSYTWKDKAQKKQNYMKLMHDLKPGVTEVIMHCIHPSEEFPMISSSTDIRYGDYLAMTDPEMKKVVEDEKIIITNWRELMERRKAVKE